MRQLFIDGKAIWIPGAWDVFTFHGVTYERMGGKFYRR